VEVVQHADTAVDAARAELRVKVVQHADTAALLEKEGASRKARLQKLQEELAAAAAANTKLQHCC
jgi:intracellular sulfur oxidation DsrE/DsrF family protein